MWCLIVSIPDLCHFSYFYTVPWRYFFHGSLCYLGLVIFRLSRLFIAALSAGKGLYTWPLFVMYYWVCVTFPCGIPGQVWYLIVSIPDLCHLLLFFSLLMTQLSRSWHRCLLCHYYVTICVVKPIGIYAKCGNVPRSQN